MQLCCRSCVAVFPPWQNNAEGSSCRLRSSLQCFFQCNLTASPLLAVTSKQSCTDLQKEKEEVCTGAEDALKTLKERHKEELVQLEDRCAIHPPSPEPASHARSDIMFSLTSLHTDTNSGRDEKKPNQNEERHQVTF